MSQSRPKELQEDDNQECSSHDGTLDAILGLCTSRSSPVDLDVSGYTVSMKTWASRGSKHTR
jgi:hypothetical protein